MTELVPVERIFGKIFLIRNTKVMLDRNLAELYGVKTKVLKQAVRRNIKRFPSDFMSELTYQELRILRSQFVSSRWGGVRYPPMAFTEQGGERSRLRKNNLLTTYRFGIKVCVGNTKNAVEGGGNYGAQHD